MVSNLYNTGFLCTEGGTQGYLSLRNQSGDRWQWKLLTICIYTAKGHVGEVKWSSGNIQRVSEGELDTRIGVFNGYTPHKEQAITGAAESWSDWMKAWLVDCNYEWWWWTINREKEGSINTHFTHSRGPFLPVCVLLRYFSTMWSIWEIGSNNAHPNDIASLYLSGTNVSYHHWNLFGKCNEVIWQQMSAMLSKKGHKWLWPIFTSHTCYVNLMYSRFLLMKPCK